ncbi:MAG: SDR family oxidoreductase [bacterium]|nr:SDR family oxidoreductase [bacterium]
MKKLENKVAIVTGGAKGIGFAIAEAYLEEGAYVVICDLTDELLNNAKEKLNNNDRLLTIRTDVTSSSDVRNMVEQVIDKYKKIDILVNNAGIVQAKSILETTDEEYERVLNVNATGTFRCIREVGKHMIKNGGSIINTSSMISLYGGVMQVAYTASKFAINGITETCAKELGRYNIRVNAVAPGIIETDMVRDNVADEVKQKLIHAAPLGRVGTPEDLKGIYVHLASNESLYTTGAIISVDGGLIM